MPTAHFADPAIQEGRKAWIKERHRQLYGANRGLQTKPRQSKSAGYGVANRVDSTGKEGRVVKNAGKRNTSTLGNQQGEMP